VIGYYSHPCYLIVYVFKDLREQQSIIYNAVIAIANICRPFLHFSLAAYRALGAEWSQDSCIPLMSNKVRLKTSNGGFMACVALPILQQPSASYADHHVSIKYIFFIYLAVDIHCP
jgi:hypothetical protein